MAKISMTGGENYNGPSSPRSQLLPFQGYTFGEIVEIVEGVSKKSGNVTLTFSIRLSEPGVEGFKLSKVQAVSGEMSGKRAGVPNVTGLYDIYFSTQTANGTEEEGRNLVRSLQQKEIDTTDVIRELQGQRVYMMVKDGTYTNPNTGDVVPTSEIDRFCSRQEFEKNANAGGHHWASGSASSATAKPAVVNGAQTKSGGAQLAGQRL